MRTVRTPTKESSSELSTKEEQMAPKNVTLKKRIAWKSSNQEHSMLQVKQHRENLIMTRLSTSEKIVLIKRGCATLFLFFCSLCHQLANCQHGYPAELCGCQVHKNVLPHLV